MSENLNTIQTEYIAENHTLRNIIATFVSVGLIALAVHMTFLVISYQDASMIDTSYMLFINPENMTNTAFVECIEGLKTENGIIQFSLDWMADKVNVLSQCTTDQEFINHFID